MTDEARHRLPDFDRLMDAAGRLTPGAGLLYFLRHPREVPALVRLGPAAARRRPGRCGRGSSRRWWQAAVSTALVTGATGFVGGHVAADLLAHGWSVRALVRPAEHGLGPPARGMRARRRRPAGRRRRSRAPRGASTPSSTSRRATRSRAHRAAEVYHTNVDGTSNVLRAAALAGAPVVHTSSVATVGLPADGSPGDEDTPQPPSQVIGAYKRSKVESERLALAAAAEGRHVVVVNPTAPVGPGRPRAHAHRAASSPTSSPAGCPPTWTPA